MGNLDGTIPLTSRQESLEETVDLIASGYKWDCPRCGLMNMEIEITKEVDCKWCKKTFLIGETNHAYH